MPHRTEEGGPSSGAGAVWGVGSHRGRARRAGAAPGARPVGEGCTCRGEGRRGRGRGKGGRRLTTSTTNDNNRSSSDPSEGRERVGERRKRERGGFSLPGSWVCRRGKWGRLGTHGGKGGWAVHHGPG
jgi:hypothetical protein